MNTPKGPRIALFVVLSALAWLRAVPLAAQAGAAASLSWERPVGSMCPSGPMLQGDVESLLGQPVFVDEVRARVRLEGKVLDRPEGVWVRLEARAADDSLLGTREMSAPAGECASLRRPLALVLAMLLDTEANAGVGSSPHERRRPLSIGAHALLWSGTLPWVRPGLSLSLTAEPLAWLSLRGHAGYALPLSVETARGVGARFQALPLGLAACPRLFAGERLGLSLCTGAQLALVFARPRKLDGPSRQLRGVAQLVLELAASLQVGQRSALELALGPLLALNRPDVTFARADGTRQHVLRPARLGAIFRLGVTIDGW